jgi:SET domain-containing protein
MNELVHSAKVVVRSAGPRGRGVFATRDLVPDELVEEVLVLPISESEAAAARAGGGVLEDYLFAWVPDDPTRALAVGTGFAPFYNHSPHPNVSLRRDVEGRRLRFVAIRPVQAGEELLFDYDCPLWFDAH